jgi:pimeloyl-ACP methyl ester carboxylesterase
VTTPTLPIWGNRDQAVGRATTLNHARYIAGGSRFVEMDAGHWLVQERFDDVAREVLGAFAGGLRRWSE